MLKPLTNRAARRALLLVVLASVSGCSTYSASPLDASGHLAEVEARSHRSEAVRTFADRLAASTVGLTFDPVDGLSLAEAEVVALLFNADLRRARLEANVARLGAAEAGRWDDPSLGIDIERIISGTDDPWVIGGLVDLTIPLSGRLRIEGQLAADKHRLAELQVLRLERQTVAELRHAWARWSSALSRRHVLDEAVADLDAIESSADKLKDAGELDPTDARLFSIDRVKRRAQLLAAEREARQAEAALRQIMGLSPMATLDLRPGTGLQATETPVDLDLHPDLAIARAEYLVAERELELEIRRQYPDLNLGGGFGTDQGDSRLLGGLSIPIPVFNTNRRAIAETHARRDVARAAFESVLTSLEAARHAAAVDLNDSRSLISLLETGLVPLVDRQVLEAQKLLDAGEFNPLIVREALNAATEAKLELISARLALDESMIKHRSLTEPAFLSPIPMEAE